MWLVVMDFMLTMTSRSRPLEVVSAISIYIEVSFFSPRFASPRSCPRRLAATPTYGSLSGQLMAGDACDSVKIVKILLRAGQCLNELAEVLHALHRQGVTQLDRPLNVLS